MIMKIKWFGLIYSQEKWRFQPFTWWRNLQMFVPFPNYFLTFVINYQEGERLTRYQRSCELVDYKLDIHNLVWKLFSIFVKCWLLHPNAPAAMKSTLCMVHIPGHLKLISSSSNFFLLLICPKCDDGAFYIFHIQQTLWDRCYLFFFSFIW